MEIDKFFGWKLVKIENRRIENNVCITLKKSNFGVVTALNVDSFDIRGVSGLENFISKLSILDGVVDAELCKDVLYYVGLDKIEELNNRIIMLIEFDSGAKITCLCEDLSILK